MPDDARDKDAHTVMWDYNVGLVRVTSFFKSLKHSKTMPARVMNANPGLRDISHSITGGSISAQGYWVPFEAAKAVSARFCFDIRYALVPVFGPDFVSMCEKCGDPPNLRLNVHPSIIQRCTEAATANQGQSRESSVAVSPRTQAAYTNLPVWPPKSLRPKSDKAMDAESGYGTDSDRSEKYPGSPDSPRSIEWTPVNSPKLACLKTYRFLQEPPRNVTSTPRGLDSPAISHIKRMTSTKRGISETEEASDAEISSGHSSIDAPASPKRRKIPAVMTPEIGAAYALMELNMADATFGERKPLKRRRASA
ncbi:MAG: hypothetical protein ALECFALPRED_008640 [Alectoria fallacina]|uniref:HTH APSES-type domain-containing protein n=1 Tax=Alectoria fallacina TaxID=1903189 RepID=A0A8H3ETE1_9LECA|nr:MAG: hypothetical protein ALECFALPRED_008640 [Alectoria fallacina]